MFPCYVERDGKECKLQRGMKSENMPLVCSHVLLFEFWLIPFILLLISSEVHLVQDIMLSFFLISLFNI